MNHYSLMSIILSTSAVTNSMNGEIAQYGFLGILLSLLIYYSRSAHKESISHKKAQAEEKKELVEAHALEKREMIVRHEASLFEEKERYNELSIELLNYLKAFNK